MLVMKNINSCYNCCFLKVIIMTKEDLYFAQFKLFLETYELLHGINNGCYKVFSIKDGIEYKDKKYLLSDILILSYACEIGLKVFLCNKEHKIHDLSKLYKNIDKYYANKILNEFNKEFEKFCLHNNLSYENFTLENFMKKLEYFGNLFVGYRYIESLESVFKKPKPDDAMNFLLNLCLAIKPIGNDYVIDKKSKKPT